MVGTQTGCILDRAKFGLPPTPGVAWKGDQMDDLLPIFQRLGSDTIAAEKFVSIGLRLGKPSHLQYTIRTFLHEKDNTDPKLFRKRMALYHGVDWNYSYKMFGKLTSPEEFIGLNCQLEINPLAGSDYLEYGPTGMLGFGWVGGDSFVFHLYVAPQVAKDIIERQLLEDRLGNSASSPDEWTTMGIHVLDYKYGNVGSYENIVTFRSVRVYC